MNEFTITGLVVVFFFTIYLIYHYAAKHTPLYVYFFVFVGWYLAFAILVLVPYDVYLVRSRQRLDESDVLGGQTEIKVFWQVLYWTVFCLCWVILPVIQQYEEVGEFTPWPRLKRALGRQVKLLLIAGVLGIAFLIYLSVSGQLTLSRVPVILVVLSNIWGLFLIILLLGYGLVSVPRKLWYNGDIAQRIRYYQYEASNLEERVIESKYQLDEIVKVVHTALQKTVTDPTLQAELTIISEKCPLDILEHHRCLRSHESRGAGEELGLISEERLVLLHKDLKKALSEYNRAQCRWEMLIEQALAHEDILACIDSPAHKIESQLWVKRTGNCAGLLDNIEWFWLTRAKPLSCRALAVVCVFFSVLVVLGEVTLFIKEPVGLFPMMFYQEHGPVLTQILCLIPLSYILVCTHSSLFYLKFQGFYGLYPHNMTDPSNLAWSASLLAKLTAPLCYNFLNFIKVKETQFYNVMGVVELMPVLGESFVLFFPSLLLVFVLLNYFNIFGKLMKSLGMSQFSFSDNFNDDKINEGKSILNKARLDKVRALSRPSAPATPTKWEKSHIESSEVELQKEYPPVSVVKDGRALHQRLRQGYNY